MLRKRLLSVVIPLIVVSLLLTACDLLTPVTPVVPEPLESEASTPTVAVTEETSPEPEPEVVEPKSLVVCMREEPDTLYWYGGHMQAARHVQNAIYDGPIDNNLYSYQPIILEKLPSLDDGDAFIEQVIVQAGDWVVDDFGNPVELAEGVFVYPSGCLSPDCAVEFVGEPVEMDRMVSNFRIKDGVAWSDGEQVTAEESVYSFDLASNPEVGWGQYIIDRTAEYVTVDDLSVKWIGLPGYIDNLYYLNFWMPMPRHLWKDQFGYSTVDLFTAEESARAPLGWGAFAVKEWVEGDHITLEKNPYYFRAAEGLPYVDTLIFRFVSDPNTALAQLLAGECDVVTEDVGLESQAELLLELGEQGMLTPVFSHSTQWEHLDFGINPAEDYKRPDFFEDVRVRQAVAYCLDRQGVVDTLLYGRSIVPDTYLPPAHPLYTGSDLVRYDYDPARGMSLLDQVGWRDEDDNGVREAHDIEGISDNTLLEFTWSSSNMPSYRNAYLDLFQRDLAECGIKVNLDTMPPDEYFANDPTAPFFGRRFDLASSAWSTGVEKFCQFYLSSDIPTEANAWVGGNVPGYVSESFDVACNRALQALPGSQDYLGGYKDSQRVFSEELPVLPLFLHIKIAATRPEVTGFVMDPTENSEMWNVEVMDLE